MIIFTELLERAKSGKIVVHTPTEEQAKALLTELDKRGYKWYSRQKLTAFTFYEDYEENICYNFGIDIDGILLCKQVCVSYLAFYQEHGYTIIEFADIDFKEKESG